MVFSRQPRSKLILIGLVIIVLILGSFYLAGLHRSQKITTSRSNRSTSEVTAVANIDKEFEFKGINSRSQSKSLKLTLVNVERKGEIKVQKETRRAAKGKDYLLIRIEIENSHPEKIALVTSNYIRLEGENGRLFAPDYHNGNVVVDPISTRRDTVVFTVDSSTKSFVFQAGELEGNKQKIEVNF